MSRRKKPLIAHICSRAYIQNYNRSRASKKYFTPFIDTIPALLTNIRVRILLKNFIKKYNCQERRIFWEWYFVPWLLIQDWVSSTFETSNQTNQNSQKIKNKLTWLASKKKTKEEKSSVSSSSASHLVMKYNL